ncbi:MAG: aldehyde dehydrogenase family protein [Candidatus Nanopelagicales bacterium]|nr:aldehyde dehydrogenase family protein [Candidatus Nanopelagicales bacterium]
MTITIPENSLLLDGSWQPAASGELLPVLDPAARETFHVAARAGAADVDAAVAAGQRAFADWSRSSPSERGAVLGRWAQLIYANVEELARLEAQDVGKPLNDARRNIYIAASILEYFAGAADKLAGATLPSRSNDHVGFTLRQPLGVCALVIAWNVPAVLMMADAAPALAAGNAVILKPSEHAPMSPLGLASLAKEAGLPDGVLSVLPGYGNEVGVPLTSHPGVSHISFVGSTLTGRAIMRSAAEHLTPVKLELGGKSPNVVFADADLDLAVDTIVESITENSGQNCYAGSRLLIQQPIYDEVVERVAARMRDQRMGAWHEDLDLGPLINDAQYERVTEYLDIAAAEGARLVAGGPSAGPGGLYVAPTLYDRVDPGMRIAREEVFGPVVAAESFTTTADAVERVNASPYGLLVAVWTNDLTRAMRVSHEVVAGQVSVNEFANSYIIGFPFNLAKESGFSKGGGYEALKEFTREKAVSMALRTTQE